MKGLYRAAMVMTVAGLLPLLAVIGAGVSYPHPFFTIGTLVGMGCVFLCLLLFFIAWILQLRQSVKNKQYGWALCVAVFGIVLIVRGLWQMG